MPIDWFTVAAQVINFVILVGLMKRFLYQPVLDAIAARELKIATALADAAAAGSEAQRLQDEFRQKNEAFDGQRAELLRQATDDAATEAERLRSEARTAADADRATLAKAMASDARHLRAEITRQTQEQVFDISRRVLGDLASVGLEQQVCAVFIRRLRSIDSAARATLGDALASASDASPALLRSAFELPPAQARAIQAALDETFGRPIALSFDTAPDLVTGIELSAQGQKLSWSIAEYLAALSSGLQKRLVAAEAG